MPCLKSVLQHISDALHIYNESQIMKKMKKNTKNIKRYTLKMLCLFILSSVIIYK